VWDTARNSHNSGHNLVHICSSVRLTMERRAAGRPGAERRRQGRSRVTTCEEGGRELHRSADLTPSAVRRHHARANLSRFCAELELLYRCAWDRADRYISRHVRIVEYRAGSEKARKVRRSHQISVRSRRSNKEGSPAELENGFQGRQGPRQRRGGGSERHA
jgi:hypothetical protein